MIIDDLDIECVSVTPPETDPPLLVDSDAVLALSITLQSLRLIGPESKVPSLSAFSCLASSTPALECRVEYAWYSLTQTLSVFMPRKDLIKDQTNKEQLARQVFYARE
jgi:hypothetical protein